jgi:hypothetical protein
MPEELEQPLASREVRELGPLDSRMHRAWIWADTAQWTGSEEAKSKPDIWAVFSTPISRRRSVARSFAAAVGGLEGVKGIWATDLEKDLDIAIALDDLSLEAQVREAFIDLVCSQLDPSEGELFVFPSEHVPDWVHSADSLV